MIAFIPDLENVVKEIELEHFEGENSENFDKVFLQCGCNC